MTTQELKQQYRDYLDVVNNDDDLDRLDQFIGPDFVQHDLMDFGGEVRGVEGKRQFIQMIRSAFPDLHLVIEDLIVEGDRVVIWWTWSGTHHGELMGIAPTERRVEVAGIEILRVEDGKYREQWTVVDFFGMMRQMGVVSSMEEIAH
jgi:steroid delta-isomerase-like uncharacterized protein